MSKVYATHAKRPLASGHSLVPAVQIPQVVSGDPATELARAERFGHHLSDSAMAPPQAATPASPPIQFNGLFGSLGKLFTKAVPAYATQRGGMAPRSLFYQQNRQLHFQNSALRKRLESTETGKKLIQQVERLEKETAVGSTPVIEDPGLKSAGLYKDRKIHHKGGISLSDAAIAVAHESRHVVQDLGSDLKDKIRREVDAHETQYHITRELRDQGHKDIAPEHLEFAEDVEKGGGAYALRDRIPSYLYLYDKLDPESEEGKKKANEIQQEVKSQGDRWGEKKGKNPAAKTTSWFDSLKKMVFG